MPLVSPHADSCPEQPRHLLPSLDDGQAPELTALRRSRLALVRTHNELARLELRDSHYDAAEEHYKASLAKCEQMYGELSPEAGEGGGAEEGAKG